MDRIKEPLHIGAIEQIDSYYPGLKDFVQMRRIVYTIVPSEWDGRDSIFIMGNSDLNITIPDEKMGNIVIVNGMLKSVDNLDYSFEDVSRDYIKLLKKFTDKLSLDNEIVDLLLDAVITDKEDSIDEERLYYVRKMLEKIAIMDNNSVKRIKL